MSNCYYISIYDQNILFKNIIDDIIFKHSEGVDLESSKERIKLGDDLFDIVKITMMKFWKEGIVLIIVLLNLQVNIYLQNLMKTYHLDLNYKN